MDETSTSYLPQGTDLPPKNPKRSRRNWQLMASLGFATGLGLVLLFMLTMASENRVMYESHYTVLLVINMGVAAFLFSMLCWAAFRLWGRYQRKKFGSKLLVKIAATFALAGLMPGLLIYGVSYQFVSRSIENWFDVRVETALNAGLSLGRSAIDAFGLGMKQKAKAAASQLGQTGDAALGVALDRIVDNLDINDAHLWSQSGLLLATAGDSRFALQPEKPSIGFLKDLKDHRVLTQIDGLDAHADPEYPMGRIHVWIAVNSPAWGFSSESRWLHLIQKLPDALVADALAVQRAHQEYRERADARQGLKRMYIGTLTLALFLTVFAAVLFAAVLGNQLIRPLLVLAEGVRDVSNGDLTPKHFLPTRDELGSLTRAFADMTRQLANTRTTVDRSMQQANAARTNLQAIMDNLTAGVVVLDAQNRIESANPSAARILRMPLQAHVQQTLSSIAALAVLAEGVQQQFDRVQQSQGAQSGDNTHPSGVWQQAFEWGTRAPNEGGVETRSDITIVARGAFLPHHKQLLVFDDVSELVSAQRTKAWSEVARRLAHEIKNPLTPIQLSAERLSMKLSGKLADADQALLNKSVNTIIEQVDAMKRLVNEFRDYSRLPSAVLERIDLNDLIVNIYTLYDHAQVPVKLELMPNCPFIHGDAQQIRQIIHNLVQNAQDATLAARPDGQVSIRTCVSSNGRLVRLLVSDQGLGFSEHILRRAFEPYVTTKAKGTGLGLAVVKKIAEEHKASVDLSNQMLNDVVIGGQVAVSFAVAN